VRERALDLAVDIYVIGAANVGKSTFINHLLQDKSIVKKGKASTRNKLLSQGLTVRCVLLHHRAVIQVSLLTCDMQHYRSVD
jgi:GTP-binding protein EngB required for normal cell division